LDLKAGRQSAHRCGSVKAHTSSWSLTEHPLSYVERTAFNDDSALLTGLQKADHFDINESYFLEIKDCRDASLLKHPPELGKVLHLQPTEEADRGFPILKAPFDFQGQLLWANQTGASAVPRATH